MGGKRPKITREERLQTALVSLVNALEETQALGRPITPRLTPRLRQALSRARTEIGR